MTLTEHGRKRARQRGIKSDHIQLLLDYGASKHKPGGVYAFFFDKRTRQRIEQGFHGSKQILDKVNGQILVCSMDNHIITCYHRR